MSERWEEGFDSWTPRAAESASELEPEVDRAELHRLGRELAAQRQRDQEAARTELDALKESLRERAAAVAERERELVELQRRLEKKGGRKAAAPPAVDAEAVSARERAALERLQAVEARERELTDRAAGLAAEAAAVEALRTELDALRDELQQSAADRELAAAERQRLEERLEDARRAEKELAAQRLELERQRQEIEARERAAAALVVATAEQPGEDTQPDPSAERESELRRLESRLETRERELALMRQGLDAQRIELREKERAVRRRDVADARQTFGPPLRPPSFSDGLAAFVSSRNRT